MGRERNHALDLAKMLGALGVVTLHVPHATPGGMVLSQIAWPTCVPFFYVASLVFFFKKLAMESASVTFSKQFRRVLVPFLSWTLIYLLLLHGKAWLMHKPRSFDAIGSFLYGESAVHLYFLPTLVCYQVIAWCFFQLVRQDSKRLVPAWAVVLLWFLPIAYLVAGDFQNRFGCSVTGNFIAAFLFITFAFFWSFWKKEGNNRWTGLCGAAIWVGCIILNATGFRLYVLEYPLVLAFGGIGFFMLASSVHLHMKSEWIAKALTASFGIYLVHVILLEGFEFLIEVFAKEKLDYSFWIKCGVIITVFLGAWGITFLLRHFRITRALLLGES